MPTILVVTARIIILVAATMMPEHGSDSRYFTVSAVSNQNENTEEQSRSGTGDNSRRDRMTIVMQPSLLRLQPRSCRCSAFLNWITVAMAAELESRRICRWAVPRCVSIRI